MHLAKDVAHHLPDASVIFKSHEPDLKAGIGWFKVSQVDEIFEILEMVTGRYILVGGNTAKGEYFAIF